MLVVVAAAQIAFAVVDTRVPWDRALVYADLPRAWEAVRSPWGWGHLPWIAAQPSGWYNIVLAVVFAVFGRSVAVLEAVDLAWVVAVLAGTWAYARGAAGPRAGVAAIAMAAGFPLVVALGRTPWIHLPEAAVVVWAAVAWRADPTLARWRTVAVMGGLGALALLVRPSGLVWVCTLAVAPLVVRPLRWRKLGVLAGIWLVASVPSLIALPAYLAIKVDARARYVATLHGVGWEAPEVLLLGALALLALPVLVILARRSLDLSALTPAVLWVTGAIALAVGFASGLFNHTLLGPGVAVIAAVALTSLLGRWGVAVAVAIGGVGLAAPLAPAARFPGLEPTDPWSHHRPWTGYGEAEVRTMLRAVCPPRRGCTVATGEGVFVPYAEEPGLLELFVMGESAMVHSPRHWSERRARPADAMVWWRCPAEDAARDWSARNRGNAEGRAVVARGMEPVWTMAIDPLCSVVWWTPTGALSGPLPERGRVPTAEEREAWKHEVAAVRDAAPRGRPEGR